MYVCAYANAERLPTLIIFYCLQKNYSWILQSSYWLRLLSHSWYLLHGVWLMLWMKAYYKCSLYGRWRVNFRQVNPTIIGCQIVKLIGRQLLFQVTWTIFFFYHYLHLPHNIQKYNNIFIGLMKFRTAESCRWSAQRRKLLWWAIRPHTIIDDKKASARKELQRSRYLWFGMQRPIEMHFYKIAVYSYTYFTLNNIWWYIYYNILIGELLLIT